MDGRDWTFATEPAHPGDILKHDLLPALGMTQAQFAEHLGVRRAAVSALLNRRADVSLEMAIRLGQAFRNGARFWLALQAQRDLWEKERELGIKVPPLDWSDGDAA